jgi:hypothetical protein
MELAGNMLHASIFRDSWVIADILNQLLQRTDIDDAAVDDMEDFDAADAVSCAVFKCHGHLVGDGDVFIPSTV